MTATQRILIRQVVDQLEQLDAILRRENREQIANVNAELASALQSEFPDAWDFILTGRSNERGA